MKKNITVLGIHDGHNSGAALVRNGAVIAAIQEERLTNIKNHSGTPINAIKTVFDIAQIHPSDIDLIAIAGLIHTHTPLKERPFHVKLYDRYARLFKYHSINNLLVKTLHKYRSMAELNSIFTNLGFEKPQIQFVEHHQSHASCAYYQ